MRCKKNIFLAALLLISLISSNAGTVHAMEDINGNNSSINLEGQWKVTEYLASPRMKVEYAVYQFFLGRSVIIEPNWIIYSIGYWPNEPEYTIWKYDSIEEEVIDGELYGLYEKMTERWFEEYRDENITVITYQGRIGTHNFIITEDGSVLGELMCNTYYLERYKQAETDLKKEQLFGEWKVKRLVSYQDGWKGSNVMPDIQDNAWNSNWTEEEGAYFDPEEYLGDKVVIKNRSLALYRGENLLEENMVRRYKAGIVDKYDYQNEKGIHDELGIVNDEIQVFTGGKPGKLWDGDIVVVNENEIIIKIYQGWYLLEKQNNTNTQG